MTAGWLFSAALLCFGAGAAFDLLVGCARRSLAAIPYLLATAGSVLLLALGIRVVARGPVMVNYGAFFGVGTTRLNVDGLAAFFLVLLFGIAIAVCLCLVSWSQRPDATLRRGLGAANLMLLGSVAVIVTSADAFSFLFGWEILSLSFYVLTGITRRDRSEATSAWLTLGIGKISGACLLFGFLLLAGRAGSFQFAAWQHLAHGDLHDIAYALVIIGFGAKLGMVPLQPWMPRSYPAAPGPTRAAMAGIAANVGAYGLWRFLDLLGAPPIYLVVAVLLIGGITALLGIAFAGVQPRLSRVVAYSSVENAGIIIAAYGVALAGAVSHDKVLEAAGLLAASLHVVAHALAKSALFSTLSNVEGAFGTDRLDALRGVGRRLRLSGAVFAAGALTLAGLPPTVGFVSEWFILEAMMQEFRIGGLAIRLALGGAGALVALTSGLAALTFIRILGLTFLGRPVPFASGSAGRDQPGMGRVGLVALGVSCLGFAAITPWEIRLLARCLSPLVPPRLIDQALKSPWVLQPVFKGFSILSPSWLWIAMPLAFVLVAGCAVLFSGGRYFRIRRVPAWQSASTGRTEPESYSAFAFANPLRHVLGNVLGSRREVEILAPAEPSTTGVEHAPLLVHRTRVIEPVERYLYRPIRRAVLRASLLAKRLQSGRLEAYVAYMLIALIAVIALVVGFT